MAALPPALIGFGVDVLRLCLWLALLLAIFVPLERLFALTPQRRLRAGFGTDLGYYFLSSLLPALVLIPPLALLTAAVRHIIPAGLHEAVAAWPLGIRLAAALVVGEIGFYWGHRWSHEWPWLWRFHAVHHSAAEIDWLTNTRAHPVDLVFTRLCGFALLVVFGLAGPAGGGGTLVPVLVILIGTLWGFFIHANLRWRLGPLEALVATPAFHRWHHTNDANIHRNYASLLPWMDRVFGTHHLPRDAWPPSYGIDEPMPPGLVNQLIEPFTPKR